MPSQSGRRLIAIVVTLAFAVLVASAHVAMTAGRRRLVTGAPAPTNETTTEGLTELGSGDAASLPRPDATPWWQPNIVASDGEALPRDHRDHTVMVYLVGSDLETTGGCASADLHEMAASGFDPARVNVVAYTGGSIAWKSGIPNTSNCVVEIGTQSTRVVASTPRSSNMGEAATLSEFIRWCDQNYPADHRELIIWDHGSGPAFGCCFDELFGYDALTLPELSQALSDGGLGPDDRLDWLGFDACLMDALEVCQACRDYAGFLVGSQDVEDGHGWNYAFLRSLADCKGPRECVASIVEEFESFFESYVDLPSSASLTLAAIDLDKIGLVEDAVDGLADALLDDFASNDYSVTARSLERSRRFGPSVEGDAMAGLVDLADFAAHVAQAHPEEARRVLGAVDRAVIANAANMSGANGMSVYIPPRTGQAGVTPATQAYARLIERYHEQAQHSGDISWSTAFEGLSGQLLGPTDQNAISMRLSDEQYRCLATMSYTVLADYEGCGYVPVLSNVPVMPDEGGAIRLPSDPEVIVSTEGEGSIVPSELVLELPECTVYRCIGTSLLAGPEYLGTSAGSVEAAITLTADAATDAVGISSASLVSAAEHVADGRAGLDLVHYKSLMLTFGGWQYPERDEAGELLPWYQWDEQGGELVFNEVPVDGQLDFASRRASELSGEFAIQVVATDVAGNAHASELIPVRGREHRVATIETKRGRLGFSMGAGQATLDSYRGRDERIEVPDTVEGVPVTKVGPGVLNNVWGVRELVLPDTLATIGPNALNCPDLERIDLGQGLVSIGRGSVCRAVRLAELELPATLEEVGRGSLCQLGVESLVLPASLSRVGEGALTRLSRLRSFEVEPGCAALTERDGALLTADGRTLLAFPAGRTGAFVVPRGVTTIGYGAFASTSLDSVTLPDGLETIDNCAFFCSQQDCPLRLASLELPGSLESVGAYAFGSLYHGEEFQRRPAMGSIHLGREVSHVGEGAFGGLRATRLSVDEGNPNYAVAGGFLCNGAGDTILEVPQGIGQVCVVPEGVTTLRSSVFALLRPGTDICIPSTVTRISQTAFPCHLERTGTGGSAEYVYDVRVHCDAGTAAAEFCERHRISWDTCTDPAELMADEVRVRTHDVTLLFHMWDDHAVLHGVDATHAPRGTVLAIPDDVEGVPVTGIDGLSDSRGIPTLWSEVRLPRALASLDTEALPLLTSERGFVLDATNEAYSVVDGVLFSADGRTLVGFALHDPKPSDRDAVFSYDVPDGVRVIAPGAFTGSELERLATPGSLRQIGKGALLNNARLRDLSFAEGLERIDAHAISCPATHITLPRSLTYLGDSSIVLAGYDGFDLPPRLTHVGADVPPSTTPEAFDTGSGTLRLGRRLTRLGDRALAALNVSDYAVDPDNMAFSSMEGLLTDKPGRKLLRVPPRRTGHLRIPERVMYLEPGCLDFATGITDVFFPDSVIGADAYTGTTASTAVRGVTFHCRRGSAAMRYAEAHGIAWTEEGL